MGGFFHRRGAAQAAEGQGNAYWKKSIEEREGDEAKAEVGMVVSKLREKDVKGFELALEHATDSSLDPALIKVATDILEMPCPKVVVGSVLSTEERRSIQDEVANGRIIIT